MCSKEKKRVFPEASKFQFYFYRPTSLHELPSYHHHHEQDFFLFFLNKNKNSKQELKVDMNRVREGKRRIDRQSCCANIITINKRVIFSIEAMFKHERKSSLKAIYTSTRNVEN